MSPDRLVHMANQIARAFAIKGEDRAVAEIADHIRKFWDPRMKAAMAGHLASGGPGLTDLARKGASHALDQAAHH